MSLSRPEFEALLNSAEFEPVDAMLASLAAEEVDDLLTDSAIAAKKQWVDEMFRKALANFFAGKART